ncbi:MAG: SusC/RagA family TonB-linked outer membrane protein [Bacteroidetes bacterium]|nr:SusC/RagA family TonB-linked outer membrane protein [Bacteroidota bacterium]
MKRLIISAIVFCGATFFTVSDNILMAQVHEMIPLQPIKGSVKSDNNEPVPAASIKVKGSTKGTSTNEAGAFTILVKPTDTLLITAVGFLPLEVPCSNKKLALILQSANSTLKEVVVGYGKERKKNITGSISSISAKELANTPALSFDNAIMGKAAGVQVISSSGVPGSATGITIRGLSTLNPDGNQPLIVIDGIPVYGSGRSLNNKTFNNSTTPMIGFGGTSVSDNLTTKNEFENNPLASLNPADIESIEILKDAYATAIYGSRGSAGVILITTKKGSKKRAAFNVQYVTGTVDPIGKYSLLNGPQYNQVYTEYYRELGLNSVFNSPYNTDWVKEVSRTGNSHQLDLSMAAGGDKAQYFISGSYTDQPSYIINNGYKRYTGRTNINYEASKEVSVGINVSMSYANNTSLNAPLIYSNAILKAPNLRVKDDNGKYLYDKGTNPFGQMDNNPVADAMLNTNSLETSESLGNLFIQYKPISSLTLRSEFGSEMNNSSAYTRRVKRPSGFGDDAVSTMTDNKKIVINNTATYLQTVSSHHYINALVGQSYEQSVENTSQIGGYNFFSDDIRSISAAGSKYILSALKQKWALVSYFGRINYEFDHKYLAGVTYRIDGSSRFSSNNRYIGFPSFSAGWRLSQEPFLKNIKMINDVKIRGSIGFTGNNSSTSYYGSQGQYILNTNNLTYSGLPILQMLQPENPNLKWERTQSIDVGLDVSLWDNRFTLTADYYQKRIKDMILASAIPLYQGWVSQPQNIGDMVNKGVELMLSGDVLRTKNFTWNSSLNISSNSNKILRLNFGGESVGLANDAYKYMKVGQPAGQFFLYTWLGVDPNTGNPLWSDGKGVVSTTPPAALFAQVADVNTFRRSYGSSLPDVFGGMSNSFTYKEWELNVFIAFSLGSKMINGSLASLLTYTTDDANNLSTQILDYWLVPGHNTSIPRLVNASVTTAPGSTTSSVRDYTASVTNSRFLEDASYARIKTLNLSYSMNQNLLKRLTQNKVHFLKLFVRATNLFTLTNYSGLDPEVSAFGSSAIQSGYDQLTMPQTKLVQFGINIGL